MKNMHDLKTFSREWWTNYWFYYRWHTIASVVVLILIVSTIVDIVTRIKPDIDITIASESVISEEMIEDMKSRLTELIDDINADNKKTVAISHLYTAVEPKDEMQMASREKLYLEFAAGDTFVFLLDKALFEFYNQEELFITFQNGEKFIPVKDLEFLGKLSSSDLVLCVRKQRDREKTKYDNTQKIIDFTTK